MIEKAGMPDKQADRGSGRRCHLVGRFVDKESCFALRDDSGGEIWLEMERIPLHLLDEEVEITGRHYGESLVWVEAIGPIRSLS